MKIFMTGATGYIGAVLRDQLLDEGHTVHAIYRPSSNKDINFSKKGITYFEGNLLDDSSLRNAMKGCEQVYHVAAYARVWSRDPSIFYNVNVMGTRNVLNLALKLGVSKAVVTSTGATLLPSGRENPSDETDRKKHFTTEYARTKSLSEKEARKYSQQGLHTIIVNPPRVYGPGLLSESNAATKLIKWYIEGKWRFIPGNGSYIGNYAFVNDVATGHRQAMKYGKSGEQYILGGKNMSFNELFGYVAEVTGKNYKLWSIPIPLIKSIAKLEKWKADTLKFKPMITPQWVENYLEDSALSSEKAIAELHYTITPPEKAIAKTVDWLNRTRIMTD